MKISQIYRETMVPLAQLLPGLRDALERAMPSRVGFELTVKQKKYRVSQRAVAALAADAFFMLNMANVWFRSTSKKSPAQIECVAGVLEALFGAWGRLLKEDSIFSGDLPSMLTKSLRPPRISHTANSAVRQKTAVAQVHALSTKQTHLLNDLSKHLGFGEEGVNQARWLDQNVDVTDALTWDGRANAWLTLARNSPRHSLARALAAMGIEVNLIADEEFWSQSPEPSHAGTARLPEFWQLLEESQPDLDRSISADELVPAHYQVRVVPPGILLIEVHLRLPQSTTWARDAAPKALEAFKAHLTSTGSSDAILFEKRQVREYGPLSQASELFIKVQKAEADWNKSLSKLKEDFEQFEQNRTLDGLAAKLAGALNSEEKALFDKLGSSVLTSKLRKILEDEALKKNPPKRAPAAKKPR